MLVLEANIQRDTKAEFQKYIDDNNMEYPGVWVEEGGDDLGSATGNGWTGNPKYLIRPDKTYYKMDYETWEENLSVDENIPPHVCGPFLTLSSPNGGEIFEQGSTCAIKWTDNGVTGNIKIELFKGGSLNKEIAGSVANSGTYDWDITTDYTPGDDYRIKVTSIQNSSLVGQSAADFSIEAIVPVNNIVKKGLTYHLSVTNSVLYYRIPESSEHANVNIRLFNAQGKEIKTLVNKAQSSGEYHVKLNNLAKGVYLCKMETAGCQKAIKIFIK